MLIRCEKCGYENFPQHRFCGMCAAALPFPVAPSARPNPEPPPQQAPKPVSRPSPAASVREPVDARSLSYLLEDEPAPSHRGRYLLLLILLAGAVAAASWHWRADLVPLLSRFSSSTGGNIQSNSSAAPASDASAVASPASSASAGTQAEKPSQGASDQTDAQASTAQAQAPPVAAPAAAVPGEADSTPSPQADQSQPSSQSQPSDSASAAPAQPAPARKSPILRAQAATASASKIDDLEAEGEKYLYGNGVPENCARARTDLLAAAQHSNAKAENVLGTMYATGHCATRDLPTAYRWFGRSLRQDPGNTRIEQDLKVLWNQMTPEEQRLALRDAR